MIRLGILGSTRGTNLIALVDAINNKQLTASIDLVVSNKMDALILEKAERFGLEHRFANPLGLKREEFDNQLSALFEQFQLDLIVLIGYMRILSAQFVKKWHNKIINVHPSLLPAFSGLMDLEVHKAVLNAREKQSGCTVHYVTEQVDAGPVIVQMKCPVYPDDSPESLRTRVQQLEGQALVEAVKTIAHCRQQDLTSLAN